MLYHLLGKKNQNEFLIFLEIKFLGENFSLVITFELTKDTTVKFLLESNTSGNSHAL
ncbi:Uncharacterised protein [Chlamydia trachomatis]|nr:Uncharacterised protein [Chlamydia trachomatis]